MLNLNLILITIAIVFVSASLSVEYNKTVRNIILRRIAEKVTKSINNDIKPCQNILEYNNCKNNKIENDLSGSIFETIRSEILQEQEKQIINYLKQNEISGIENKLKIYIESCEKRDYQQQLENLSIAKTLGGWPYFKSNWNWNRRTFDWILTLGELNAYNISTFISTKIKRSTNTIYISLTISHIKNLKKQHIIETLKKFNLTQNSTQSVENIADNIISFNEKLYKIRNVCCNSTAFNTISTVQFYTPRFNWHKYLTSIFGQSIYNIASSYRIKLDSFNKFYYLINLIEQTNKRILANYFMWNIIENVQYSWEMNCSIPDEMNNIGTKIFLENILTDTDANLMINSEQENMKLLKILINNKTITDNDPELNDKFDNYIHLLQNRLNLVNETTFNTYYKDLDIVRNNHLQNLLNFAKTIYKTSYSNNNLNIDNKIYPDEIKYLRLYQGYPSALGFSINTEIFWPLTIIFHSPALQDQSQEQIIPCQKNMHTENSSNETINLHLLYNEVLIVAFKAYTNWMNDKNNDLIQAEENNILKEYGLNNKKLFLLITLQNACSVIKSFAFQNEYNFEVVSKVYDCPIESYMKCRLFEHIHLE